VELKVDLSGTGLESAATLFPEGDAVMATMKLDLPAPVVTGAENGYLDPTTIPADGVNVRVPAYGGQAAGQWVYARFTGQNGSREQTAPVQVVSTTAPLDFKISKIEVLKNENRAVAFEYRVAQTQGGVYSDSEPAPIDIERARPITQPFREDFEGFASVDSKIIQLSGCRIVADSNGEFQLSESFQQPPFITGKSIICTSRSSRGAIFQFIFESLASTFRLGLNQDAPIMDVIEIRFEGDRIIRFQPPRINGWLEVDSAYYFYGKISQVILYTSGAKPIYIDNVSYTV